MLTFFVANSPFFYLTLSRNHHIATNEKRQITQLQYHQWSPMHLHIILITQTVFLRTVSAKLTSQENKQESI